MSIKSQPLLLQPGPDWGALWDEAMRDGAFETAWAINDQVLAARDPATRDDPSRPYHERWIWDGRSLDGQDVLVRCYHGLGDTLQFWRYLAPLAARAASVTVEVQPELIPLLAGLYRLIPFQPDAPTAAACDVEIMELGHALRLPPPPPHRIAVAPSLLLGSGRRIGLCWAAGGWDPDRSIPLRLLKPLAQFGQLVSLQRGPASDASIPDCGGGMDILQTARIIRALDMVVTVDTMVAHLSALVGTPTSVLLKHHADWRWGRQGSPWYDQHALFRQPSPGAWEAAVAALTHAPLSGNPEGIPGFVA